MNQVGGESDNLTFGKGEYGRTPEQMEQVIREISSSRHQLFLVATINQRIVGGLMFETGHRPRVAHKGEVSITVLKAHWGEGIASALMDTFHTWAEGQPTVRKITLEVLEQNVKAVKLYEKYGYKREGLIERGLMINGEFHNVIVMGRNVDHHNS